MSSSLFGLVEAGGTKFVLGVADENCDVKATTRIPTTTPNQNIRAMLDWFATHAPLAAVGVASFGPLELDRARPDWGHITKTTKPGWSHADIAGPLVQAFNCPVAFDTDVNAAALAEYRWGAGQGQRTMLYFTVGTGIGGGGVIEGKTLHGLSHPEMGHIRIPRHPHDLAFSGSCPFHGDCLEGLASGPAIKARWGGSLSELAPDHEAHDIIAWYLAQTVCTMQSIFAPGRIIFGGGVMATPGLIDRIRSEAEALGNGYFVGDLDEIVTLPGLGDQSGLMGALALALG
jgi:fructokinase